MTVVQGLRQLEIAPKLILLGKEVLIQTFELDCPGLTDAHPVLNHQVCEALSID